MTEIGKGKVSSNDTQRRNAIRETETARITCSATNKDGRYQQFIATAERVGSEFAVTPDTFTGTKPELLS